ncbi:unnamed protein product [Vitrella brassicaformis CCMP3155]|uniref:C2 domain-containing protein n=5 Tax=Vitrella brassicaformis TaxID=1169539 RepID=A0A0G4F7I2_VITBC|nr:unnamed protein product [Vitrella brassicaformis CCMP3155]|eukprot:CEM08695.1 unnamed protein product [Vitrella brassicaformis CCMP3155]
MGKICTKHAKGQGAEPLNANLNHSRSFTGGEMAGAVEVGPPHKVVDEEIEEISKTYKFFVHIWGIKCRNLKGGENSFTFVVLNWDDYALEKKTRTVKNGANPKWNDVFQFHWTASSIRKMKDQYLIITVCEDDKGQGNVLGSVKMSLYSVASGPIHHDFRLEEAPGSKKDCGRVIFDIRMSQICQLLINPVEILVSFHPGETFEDDSETSPTREASLDDDDVDTSKIDMEADPIEDETEAIEGEWQLVLSPTGVEGEQEYFSTWTEKCSNPYWNAVDDSKLPDMHVSSSHVSLSPQSKARHIVSGDHLDPSHIVVVHPHPFTNDANFLDVRSDLRAGPPTPSPRGSPPEPLSPFPLGSQPFSSTDTSANNNTNTTAATTATTAATGSTSPPLAGAQRMSIASVASGSVSPPTAALRSVTNSTPTTTTEATSKSPQRRLRIAPVTALDDALKKELQHSHSYASLHPSMHALDRQATYHKLTLMCRKGRLARGMLLECLPTIQLETTMEELHHQHIHFKVYLRRLGLSSLMLCGEVWLPFLKMYDPDVVDTPLDKHFFDSYFREKLWRYGKAIGHIEGIVVFQNNPTVRQLLAGVHTEDGFRRISPPILGAEHKSVNFFFRNQDIVPVEIKKITQLHQTLLDTLFAKGQHKPQTGGESFSSVFQRGRSQRPDSQVQDLPTICEQLLALLKTSHAETRKSFIYQNESAMLTGQRVLLNLGNHVLEYVDYILWQHRTGYCAMLHQILKRGELDIGTCLPELPEPFRSKRLPPHDAYLCYKLVKQAEKPAQQMERSGPTQSKIDPPSFRKPKNEEAAPLKLIRNSSLWSMQSDADNESTDEVHAHHLQELAESLTDVQKTELILYHKRMKLCRQYYLLLLRMLYYSLDKLSNDAVFEGQKKYLSIFLCTAYFRLPHFREDLLGGLLTKEEREMQIEEWRGTEYNLFDPALSRLEKWVDRTDLQVVLDWGAFHRNLRSYFGEGSLEEAAASLTKPKGDEWKERICKRGTAFFSFLEHWSKHVYQLVPNKQSLRWHLIAGYATLLKGLLLEMKYREVTKYPDSMLNSSGAMLANERLLSVFIKILFLKTSAYHPPSVFSAMNYLDYWMQVLSLRNQPLPPNFDFHFLLKGLDILVGCDMCLNVAKGLWFIYKNLSVFQGTHLRGIVLDLLINKYFIVLFLNWSWLVRKCYIWFLLYRVCEAARRTITRISSPMNKLTADEKTMLDAYSRLCWYLNKVGAPPVFPHTSLPRYRSLSSGEGQEIAAACAQPGAPVTTTTSGPTPSPATNNGTVVAAPSQSDTSTLPVPDKDSGRRRGGTAGGGGGDRSSLMKLAVVEEIPEECNVYIESAVPEFTKELAAYRDWVMAGADPLPTMHIPASPLDQNVDVPLENW